METTRTIEIYPGWDKRDKGEGFHGAEILFTMRCGNDAVTFACYTDWLPVSSQNDRQIPRILASTVQPKASDFTLHFDRPLYSSRQVVHRECPYLPNGLSCYSLSNMKTATELRDILLNNGSRAVWKEIDAQYNLALKVILSKDKGVNYL